MPLNIVIIGAGLGGLGAAIALNRAGHDVTVLEKSRFLNEIGAAIHVAPNASRILKKWGLDLDTLQGVHCRHVTIWDCKGELRREPSKADDLRKGLGVHDEWLMTHRVDLHAALRDAAVNGRGDDGRGQGVDIQLEKRVVSVDAEAGQVALDDGTVYTADLIVGADGIHSRTVHAIPSVNRESISTGQNCFRFLLPVAKMEKNPVTSNFVKRIGLDGLHAFSSHDRRLVIYPCRRGELLNVAGICPDNLHTEGDKNPNGNGSDSSESESWHNAGTVQQLLDTFKDFGPELRAMCSLAEDVKLWSLASRDPAPSFVCGRLALLGDAAHPMLPHQGQGAAQAIEDAAALGALLPASTKPSDLPSRLEMYNKLRFSHAVTVMMMSRIADDRRGEMLGELRRWVPGAELPESMFAFAWVSDPIRDGEGMVKEEGAAGRVKL